jgi:hypothetical protein
MILQMQRDSSDYRLIPLHICIEFIVTTIINIFFVIQSMKFSRRWL